MLIGTVAVAVGLSGLTYLANGWAHGLRTDLDGVRGRMDRQVANHATDAGKHQAAVTHLRSDARDPRCDAPAEEKACTVTPRRCAPD